MTRKGDDSVRAEQPLNQLTAQEVSDGWKLLFDGKSTDGWRNFKKDKISDGWQVVDGALTRAGDGAGDIVTEDEYEAFELVLRGAGATLPKRDPVDARVVQDVRDRTGRLVNSQADVGGWPELKSAPAAVDSDGDGMPDAWERARGLKPDDAADGRTVGADGYTNVEHYLNELADRAMEGAVATRP